MLTKHTSGDMTERWGSLRDAYGRLITDSRHSSSYLRERGLKPTLLRLLGDCSDKRVLDVGTGSGWLFDELEVGEAVACDLVPPRSIAPHVDFSVQNGNGTTYADASFDVLVSSLMLCYCADLSEVLGEFRRIAKTGGRLVVSLVHPYFYRTGEVTDDGSFVVTTDLAESGEFSIEIGREIGPFGYYYRTYPEYLNAMIGSGWSVDRVEDWFMSRDDYVRNFGSEQPRSAKVPIFTFMSCTAVGSGTAS